MFKNILLVVFVIFLIALLVFAALKMGVAGLWTPVQEQTQSEVVLDSESTPFNPTGDLLLNFAKTNETDMSFFIYDVESKQLEDTGYDYFWPQEAVDVPLAVAARMFELNGNVVSAIVSYSTDGIEKIVYASSTVGRILNAPKVSPSGTRYAFSVSAGPQVTLHDEKYQPSKWRLYVGELSDGEPRFIANGSAAYFSQDSEYVLYLADDGFHTYNLATGEDIFVNQLSTPLPLTYFMADISPDGKRIAITSSPTEEVKVGNILSWNPFEIEWTHSFNELGYWPVFSPDSEYLAFMNFDWIDGHPGNRRILITDLRTDERQYIAGLESYTDAGFFISDWVK